MKNITEFNVQTLPEFPDSGEALIAGQSYIVSANHKIYTSNQIIPPDVTLYFTGGILSPNSDDIKLTGNRTRISAPIEQIFDKELDIAGTWQIEQALPHWFGMKTCAELLESENIGKITDYTQYDCSDAINKAIRMKRVGTVFIPQGKYIVQKSISVIRGIHLTGETGATGGNLNPFETTNHFGTFLYAMPGAQYDEGYMVQFNSKTNTGDDYFSSYLTQGSIIQNIGFVNGDRSNKSQKCICARGGFELNNCIWNDFAQAVKTNEYSDTKKVVNCTYYDSIEKDNEGDWMYAFDLGGLGDALIFQRNAVHDFKYHKALRLSYCGGGLVSANILNSDVTIENCKGIVFESNHMEGGAQIRIISSVVSLNNNFIYKGIRPAIVISNGFWRDNSTITMTGNMFLLRYQFKTNGIPNTLYANDVFPYEIEFIKNNEAVQSFGCNLMMQQNYRYDMHLLALSKTDEFEKLRQTGIQACITDIKKQSTNNKSNGTSLNNTIPFLEFNKLSYILSNKCQIMPQLEIVFESYTNNLQTDYSIDLMHYGDVLWLKETGTYRYSSVPIYDFNRRIKGKMKTIDSIELQKNGNGVLIALNDFDEINYLFGLRLYRMYMYEKTANRVIQFADIPICGCQNLYDNGVNINGYSWINAEDDIDLGLFDNINWNTDIESVSFTGDRVICRGASKPLYGEWQKGDIVFNTSTQSNVSMWINDGNGGWIER